MTIPNRKIEKLLLHDIEFTQQLCRKCGKVIGDGRTGAHVFDAPVGNHPVRVICRNCKKENFICFVD